MNIGIIIFIISIIVTGISAMRDKSHEQRKNQRPPQPKESTSDKKETHEKGFFEQIEEAFNELEKEFTNEDKPSNKQKKDKQPNTKRVYQDQKLEKEIEKESVPEELERSTRQRGRVERETRQSANSRESNRDSNKLQKELEKQLVDDLYNVRTEIDREKEKQLSRIENEARAIINDKNLSERTKRYRLKQLLNSKAIEQDMTHQSFQFDNDPVVNGILWQEILNKPKQL
ncbi:MULTISPECIES: hypothetical protein [Staphylococcus]|uniref:hypothetical protein n=1 Tax=Staphylococcus TaxID=1279 RepID=UPI00069EDE95|nr:MULTISPECIES: hypothetical protein [Staphylococcus]MCH4443437.1 hypothetical protein [Staphylococcus haemolyticus]OFK30534.1 hypothetical protein HMPREF2821_09480 [Staphylococcus sp. HMSC065C10]